VIERNAMANPHIHIDTVLSYSRCTLHDTTLLSYLPYFHERGVGTLPPPPPTSHQPPSATAASSRHHE
jgi:hypothetical protein